jgi:hypothetical protein
MLKSVNTVGCIAVSATSACRDSPHATEILTESRAYLEHLTELYFHTVSRCQRLYHITNMPVPVRCCVFIQQTFAFTEKG